MRKSIKLKLAIAAIIVCCGTAFSQGNSKFKVVLDAGHGGKDYGAVYHGFIEKNIALNVTLKVGKILERDPGVQVIYTRKTDVFIELDERPTIANKADANLFVSIHCNGEAKKQAFGTETFVMGPTKNASNLEVAKKENAVISMEADKTKYAGFDPSRPETLIGLSLQQDVFIDQSIDMASKIQNAFTDGLKRKNRGVKQAPFLVLHRNAMPSVLVELGFLSYKPEGQWLNSEEGQNALAEAIAESILQYKREHPFSGFTDYNPIENTAPVKPVLNKADDVKDNPVRANQEPSIINDVSNGLVIFKVQISAGGMNLDTTPENFKGLNNISKTFESPVYKYYYGETNDYGNTRTLLEEAKAKGYTSAFVVAFKDGKKITVKEALQKR